MPKKKVKIRKGGMGEKAWYGKEWKGRKREMRRKMTKFMKGKCSRETLTEEKRCLNSLYMSEMKEHRNPSLDSREYRNVVT